MYSLLLYINTFYTTLQLVLSDISVNFSEL